MPPGIEWTPILLSVLALVSSAITAWHTSSRKDRASIHVERADKIVDLQAEYITRLEDDAREARDREKWFEDEVAALREQLRTVLNRVGLLEQEVIRLGGDPTLVRSPE